MHRSPPAKIYVILGSHACRTGMLLLEHKQIPYSRVTLPTGLHPMVRTLGFSQRTVPAVDIGGRRVQTNRAIARALDRCQPEPPLFPRDEALRTEVEQAELWGDEVFQMAARRTVFAAFRHDGEAVFDATDGPLGPLLWRHARTRRIGGRLVGRLVFDVTERSERELLAALPAMLDRIDAWIEAGVLHGEQLYAADYMIATSLSLLLYRRDLRSQIRSRRAGALADRVLPGARRSAAEHASPSRITIPG